VSAVAKRVVAVVLPVVLASILLASCGGVASSPSSSSGTVSSTTSLAGGALATTSATESLQDAQADLFSPAQEVLDSVYSSVVNIRVQVTVRGQTAGGVGSGVVYTADGLILTNDHVVSLDGQVTTGQQITVTFSDGSTAPATVVKTDAQKDVAAIQVQKTGLTPVTFGFSKDVRLAQWAIVIGSPLDFRNTVTLGIVSGLDRTLDTGTGTPPLTGLMQIDTPISPGNSGGGCFDTQGRFIGMPEVYLPPAQTGAENIGFCIPADVVASVAKVLTGR
jgi:S1-C subfamily serine protease